MAEEFCYLEKRDHAYDFVIVEFDKRNEKEYMTLSARVLIFFFTIQYIIHYNNIL